MKSEALNRTKQVKPRRYLCIDLWGLSPSRGKNLCMFMLSILGKGGWLTEQLFQASFQVLIQQQLSLSHGQAAPAPEHFLFPDSTKLLPAPRLSNMLPTQPTHSCIQWTHMVPHMLKTCRDSPSFPSFSLLHPLPIPPQLPSYAFMQKFIRLFKLNSYLSESWGWGKCFCLCISNHDAR